MTSDQEKHQVFLHIYYQLSLPYQLISESSMPPNKYGLTLFAIGLYLDNRMEAS
jgi:hypothetical protein